MSACPGHGRHWFTLSAATAGDTGWATPVCTRCGAPNPREITTDEWRMVLDVAPHLLENPEAIREWLDNMSEGA